MEQDKNIPPEQEPTILDLYKSVTKDWSSFFNFIRSLWDARRREEFNQTLALETAQPVEEEEEQLVEPPRAVTFPWRAMLALFLALGAQALVEPPNRQATFALALALAAIGAAVWSYRTNEWHLPALPSERQTPDPLYTRLFPLILAIIFALVAFIDFGYGTSGSEKFSRFFLGLAQNVPLPEDPGKFTAFNTSLWILSIGLLVYSLWIKIPGKTAIPDDGSRHKKFLWNGLVLAVLGLSIFYRIYQLDTIPIEPFSDHAEKILDVYEITEGNTFVFFERNTGREAFQMYWTLLVAKVFGTGFSFFSLKLGTVLLGLLTLPYMYLLGREYGNERVALFALFLFGIACWPNITSRIGLRFPLYPLFFAPTLLYLTRGLRTHNRNDFILCGIFLGLGLHGYSPFRIVPVFVVIAFLLYFLHTRSSENRQQAAWWFVIVVAVSLFVFLPLLRYWAERPDLFGYRALSRLSDIDSPLPGPPLQIFLSNLYDGLLLFNWNDGVIWVHSVTNRPALDLVTAALFLLGVVLLIVRYIRQRDWRDLLLLVSIPILIMPSVLSLAYPGENPALNRAGGAAVTAILISALALDGFVSSFGVEKRRQVIAYGLTGALFAVSAFSNYNLVFDKFQDQYTNAVWNTAEMGRVLGEFRDQHGQTDTVWIVPYPFWVDTRLPGVWAGVPNRDFAMWQDRLEESLNYPAPKMFMFWNKDEETEKILRELYPNGKLRRYTSAFEGKDFYIFLVEE